MNDDWRTTSNKWFYSALGQWVANTCTDDDLTSEVLHERIRNALADWTYYVTEDSNCGSPIEAIFFAHAMFMIDGYNEVKWEPFAAQNPPPDFGTWFRTQEGVGRYRVDFLFTCYCQGKTRKLIVECDGHEFHERTKEQATRDRSRDREMTTAGATVIRFTGSELHKDPFKCAAEAEALLNRLMEEAMAEAGVIKTKGPGR